MRIGGPALAEFQRLPVDERVERLRGAAGMEGGA